VSDRDPRLASSILITAGDIAEIAGVSPSAVSNWKRRHSDFPGEIEDGLYDRSEVVAWLREAGKSVNLEPESTEAVIWRLADAVRGVLRLDELPEVLLQLFALRAAGSGEYGRLQPLANSWERLRTELQEDLGAVYQSIVASVGESDPELARALRFSSAVNRFDVSDWQRLVSLVDQLDPHTTNWRRASTALIEGFVERHGAKGGEHSSGSSLVDVMTALLAPIQGSVYDPACGSAVFLAEAWRQNRDAITRLYGQEINEHSWRLGFLHLLLQNADFELVTGDTLLDDRLWQLRADRIALEPPLNLHLRLVEQMEGDPRWSWGLPQKSSADLAWVQHVAFHLSDEGVGAVAVSPGALARSHSESQIRQGLVESDMLDAVVHLPPGMLASASIPIAVLVLQRNRSNRSGHVLFVDARQLGSPERGGLRRFEPSEIDRLRDVFRRWRSGSLESEGQFAGIATVDEIIASGVSLSPNRYISYARIATHIDGELISERLERLARTLDEQMEVLELFYGREDEIRRLLAVEELDPSQYTEHRLGELLVIAPQSGVRQKDGPSEQATGYVTADQVRAASDSSLPLIGEPTERTYDDVRDRLLERDDLLLYARGVGSGSVHCAIVSGATGATYSESLVRLRVDQDIVHPGFLQLYLTSRRGASALAAAITGSVIRNLDPFALQEVEVFLPDIETQRHLAEVVELMELQLDELEAPFRTYWDFYDAAREAIVAGIFADVEYVDNHFVVRATSRAESDSE
jgi:type I restriction enzyme M protein